MLTQIFEACTFCHLLNVYILSDILESVIFLPAYLGLDLTNQITLVWCGSAQEKCGQKFLCNLPPQLRGKFNKYLTVELLLYLQIQPLVPLASSECQ